MASALTLLDALEQDEFQIQPKRPSTVRSSSVRSSAFGRRRSVHSPPPTKRQSRPTQQTSRPQSLPPASKKPQSLPTPPPLTPSTTYARSERSPSQGPDARRISFADPPRPSARRLRIATKTDALSSGFPYDPRLSKYGVGEEEWHHFSSELVDAAEVPGPSWTWAFHRKDVIRRIKKELQYEGELKRVLRRRNKDFKKKRFQAWLELPAPKDDKDLFRDLDDEERQQAKRDARRFRIVITPDTERAPSVYSRSSSLTRSVSGEGVNLQSKADSG